MSQNHLFVSEDANRWVTSSIEEIIECGPPMDEIDDFEMEYWGPLPSHLHEKGVEITHYKDDSRTMIL